MIKKPIIEGTFYPKEKQRLVKMLDEFFQKAEENKFEVKAKKLFAIIAPHAGYVFSGQTAVNIYQMVKKYEYKTAIIVAPSHYSTVCEFFVGNYEAIETPFGLMQTNQEMIKKLLSKKDFCFDPSVDLREHSLDIHLPILHYIDPDIKVVPILFVKQSNANAKILCDYLKDLINDDTLLIISTDLSHYYKSTVAKQKDSLLIENIKNFDLESLKVNLSKRKVEACGFGGILTLLELLKSYDNVEIDHLSYTHSGMTTNDHKQVVGYLSCGFYK